MIDWKKYDPMNPPQHWKVYLVTNGKRVISAYLDSDKVNGQQWWEEDQEYLFTGVTHYAEINLPNQRER
ncbi:hypothetical protein RW092_00105 [Paenibacillus sp. 3LSP]|uniref:hypothetical protein n=1 Tax=Paenibacillus sp. 3LSP TaxID=2800795 RepID=UPI0028FCFDE4|nr:hypothetical protein [Paenibacillus sp. 3LSP]MDU0328606.1 hypothetical protein [Paenibacillus sp. 3LSP]